MDCSARAVQVHPACLLPLFKAVLAALQSVSADQLKQQLCGQRLSMLGDLEEVWADQHPSKILLALPLESMEVLLSCDELKVG